jgi:hypothetical protein
LVLRHIVFNLYKLNVKYFLAEGFYLN